jgi:outer membrane immunogenic protein
MGADMKKILLATVFALGLVGTSSAADLGAIGIGPVFPVAPPLLFTWTGCYVGGFLGGARADDVHVDNGLGFWTYELDQSFIGGGTLGCNWQQIGSPIVLGIEGELGYINLSGSGYDPQFPLGSNVLLASSKIGDSYAMITGRLGYAVDRVQFYLKGGVAFVEESVTVTQPAFPGLSPAYVATVNNNDARWTWGGGIEWAFANDWTLKAEYMFIGSNDSTCAYNSGYGASLAAETYCWEYDGAGGISTAKIGLNYLFFGGGR